MDSDMDNSTSNYYSRAMQKKKKMQSRAGFFTLIGRSVDTTVNGDRTNHRVLRVDRN